MQRENPLPGMNPFMERTWSDVRLSLLALILTQLGSELPEDLSAKAEQQGNALGDEAPHRWVEIRSDEGRLITVIDLLRGGPVTVDVVGFDYQRQKPGLGEHYLT